MKFGARENNHMVDILFTLALFCVFTASALLVVVIGANVYRSTVARMQDNYSARTALSYVTEKVRQHDTAGSVGMYSFDDGTPAIELKETYDTGTFNTYIYESGGELNELYIASSVRPEKSAGRKIMDVSEFTVDKISDSLLYVTVQEKDGSKEETYISVHSDADGTGDE